MSHHSILLCKGPVLSYYQMPFLGIILLDHLLIKMANHNNCVFSALMTGKS